jgi:hypothetical protein
MPEAECSTVASNRRLSAMVARLFASSATSTWNERAILKNLCRSFGSGATAASSRHLVVQWNWPAGADSLVIRVRAGGTTTASSSCSSLGLCRFCRVRRAPVGFGGEFTQPFAELKTSGQGEPPPLHVQKVLLKGRIGLSGGFPRAFCRVLVTFANLLAQTLKHRTHCLAPARARLIPHSPTSDGFLIGDGAILRPQHACHNATKANLSIWEL